MASRVSRPRGVALALSLAALAASGGVTFAAFSAQTSNNASSVAAAPDWTAPSASRSVIARSSGGNVGTISKGDGYYVYAEVTDSGNPPSGVASATADVGAVTAGQTAVALSSGPCPCTVDALSYNHRSALLTADDPLADGVKGYSITSSDSASPLNTNTNTGFSVSADSTPPTISAAVVQKSTGGSGGYIKQGASYYVYANVTDATGVASASADTGSFDTGETAAPLSAGSWTVDGTTYSRRSALLTAEATIAEGAYGFSITATDTAGQAATRSSDSVQVDNTAPTATDVQAVNAAANAGRPEQNDTLTYTFSEPVEPSSILAGWTGAATDVVVRIANSATDTLTIANSADTAQLPFGSLDLGRADYVSAQQEFGKGGQKSVMSRSGNSVTVVLGLRTANVSTTAAATGTMTWAPSATATDRAGNAMTTTALTETGAADKEF